MSYNVTLKPRAEKALRSLETSLARRILDKLKQLEANPRPSDCKKLKSANPSKYRVRDWRILYTIDDAVREVDVHLIIHRSKAY